MLEILDNIKNVHGEGILTFSILLLAAIVIKTITVTMSMGIAWNKFYASTREFLTIENYPFNKGVADLSIILLIFVNIGMAFLEAYLMVLIIYKFSCIAVVIIIVLMTTFYSIFAIKADDNNIHEIFFGPIHPFILRTIARILYFIVSMFAIKSKKMELEKMYKKLNK